MNSPQSNLPEALERILQQVQEKNLTYLPYERLRTLAELCIATGENRVQGVIIETGWRREDPRSFWRPPRKRIAPYGSTTSSG